MDIEIKSSKVVFFLGAGASVPAGVPDTYTFVNEFIKSISDPDKKSTVEKIVNILKEWVRSRRTTTKVDIELLLETLTKLQNRNQDPLFQFFKGGSFELDGYVEKKQLINDLKNFIKSKAIVSDKEVEYFQPLVSFIEEERPLDIISVNYDTCVEQFCNINKLKYQDGFDVYWNPKVFYSEDTDIRLYKLHGSVIWYQSDRGEYIKNPVMTESARIELITGETAENLMLYPMQKWDYAEPLLELLVHIKKLLESETCKYLIVVGYSFRDEHIRRIIWDSARKNKNLKILIIDPKAYQIYNGKLKYYDDNMTIPSSLHKRVLCLPYEFEYIFSYIKNYYIKNLTEALFDEKALHIKESNGEKVKWKSILNPFIKTEYIEKIEDILNKSDDIIKVLMDKNVILRSGKAVIPLIVNQLNLEHDIELILNLIYVNTVHSLANNQLAEVDFYIKLFNDILYKILVEKNCVEITTQPGTVNIRFNCYKHEASMSFCNANTLINWFSSITEFYYKRAMFIKNAHKYIRSINLKLESIKNYLGIFGENGISFEKYLSVRRENIKIKDIEELNELNSKIDINKLRDKIKHLETKIIKKKLATK